MLGALDGRAHPCGSLRRLRPTVGDVDLVLDGISIEEAVGRLGLPVVLPANSGPRTMLRAPDGLAVDLWVPVEGAVGACVLHATGSGFHNALMRRWSRLHGVSVTWRGAHRISDDVRLDDGTEDDVRRVVGWPLLEPWEREVDLVTPPDWLVPLLAEMDRLEVAVV